ncbi:MAG: hypothetical protein A3J83_07215 [Elusimicrobia bacterium RIFOXYA2_FULL_40_6]|nr:MAG: hypothetical protein A3J83_07215 [Elusimicrobia bacterium RIFOXYA2_FULL_40_6]
MVDLPIEKLVELGDKRKADNDYVNSIRYYRNALKIAPENKDVLFKLAEAYTLKAQDGSEIPEADYQFAMNYYRDIIRLEPTNEQAHHKLIFLSMKNRLLGELAVEYKEKVKKYPENILYKECLEQLSVLVLFDKDITKHDYASGYRPSLPMRIIFDFLLMPASLTLIALSIFNPMFKGMFLQSFSMLLFYAAYRIIIHRIHKA